MNFSVHQFFNRRAEARRLKKAARRRRSTAVRGSAFESLEGRALLAITGLPAAGPVGAAIVLSTDGLGPNDLSITLFDTTKGGVDVVAATITAGAVTNTYWDFKDSITFTGTFDTDGSIANAIKVYTPYGVALTTGATGYDWTTTAKFNTAVSLNDVSLAFTNADSLYLGLPAGGAGASFGSTIAGAFNSPTFPLPNPGGAITLESSGDITTAGAVSAYDLTLKNRVNGVPAAAITVSHAITVGNAFTVDSETTFAATAAVSSLGTVAISADTTSTTAAVTGGTGVSITGGTGVTTTGATTATTGDLAVTATTGDISLGALVQAVAGKATIEALAGTITAHDDITSSGALTVTTKNTFTAAAKTLSSTAGAIAITVDNGDLDLSSATLGANTTLGLTATAGGVKVGQATSVGDATITGNTGVALAGSLTSSTGDVQVTATTGNVSVAAGKTIEATVGDVSLTATAGAVVSQGTLTAGGQVTVTAGTTSTTAAVTGGTGVSITGGTGVTTTGATTATTGTVSLTATTGNVSLGGAVTAVSGGVSVTASAGTISGLGVVTAYKSLTVVADGGFAPTSTSLTSTNGDINLTFKGTIDLSATPTSLSAPNGSVVLESVNGNIKVDVVNVNQAPANPATDGRISVKALSGSITLGQNLTAGGNVTVRSKAGLVLDKSITSNTGDISLTSDTGPITLNAGATIYAIVGKSDFVAAAAITVGDTITAAKAVSLKAASLTVNKAIASTTSDVTIEASAGNIIFSGSPATVSAASGAISFTAAAGQITTNKLQAKNNVTLSSKSSLSLSDEVSSLTGNVSLTSTAGGIALTKGGAGGTDANVIALNGTVTLSAFTAIDDGNGSAVPVFVKAKALDVQVQGGGTTAPVVAFTNANNDVEQLSVKLQSAASVPTGAGITFVDANSLTISNLVTATGKVDITSLAGQLTVSSAIGTGTGVMLAGVSLTSVGDIKVTGSGGISVAGIGDVSLTSSAGSISISGLISVSSGKATVNAALGSVAVNGATSASGDVTITALNAFTASSSISSSTGDISLRSIQGDVDLSGASAALNATGGAIAITADRGQIKLGFDLVAGTNITLSSLKSFAATKTLTANSGNVSINTAGPNADIDLSGSGAGVSASQGAISLGSLVGKVSVGTPLTAKTGITLSSYDTLSVTKDLTVAAGPLTLTSTSGNVGIKGALSARNQLITLDAFNLLDDGSAGAITTAISGDKLIVKAQGGLGGNPYVKFTNVNNDVDQLSVLLQTAAATPVPVGQGITFVDTNGLTVTDAITATGAVDIEAKGGLLTVSGTVGTASGVSLTGVRFKATGGITVSDTAGIAATSASTGAITLDSGNTIAVTGPIAIAAGSISLTGVGNVSVGKAAGAAATDSITASGTGDVAVTSGGGSVTLAGNLAANGGKATVEAKQGTVSVQSVLAQGNLAIESLNAFTAATTTSIASSGGSVSLKVDGAASNLDLTQLVTLGAINGSLTLQADGGSILVKNAFNLTAGTNLTVKSAGSFAPQYGLTATTGSVNLQSTAGDVNLTSNAAVITSANGGITLTAGAGSVLFNANNSLLAKNDIAVSSLNSLAANTTLTSLTGNVGLTSQGDITITANIAAINGDITLDAKGSLPAVTSSVQAKRLFATIQGSGSLPSFSFTNSSNDVDELQVTLASTGGIATGTGITYRDANALSVTKAVTATGTVDIQSLGGSLTVSADLANAAVTLSGIKLQAADFVKVTGGGGLSVAGAGSVTVTSDSNAITVTGPISTANGGITLTAVGDIEVQGAAGINAVGTGDITASSSGGSLSVTGDIKAANGKLGLSAQQGSVTVQKLEARDDLSVAALTTFTPSNAMTSTAGNLAITVTGPAANVDLTNVAAVVTVPVGKVTFTSAQGKVLLYDRPLTVGSDLTISAFDTFTLANALVSSAGSISITSASGDVDLSKTAAALTAKAGALTLTATQGALTVGGPLNAGQNISLTGLKNVTATNAIASTNGNVAVTSNAGDVDLSSTSATIGANAGDITLSAPQGKVTVGTTLLAGYDIRISSLNTYAGTKSLTSQGGNISVLVTGVNQDVDLSSATATIGVSAGGLALAATNGSIKLNAANSLVALYDVTLSSLKSLSVTPAVQSNVGNVLLMSTAGDVKNSGAVLANAGNVSLRAAAGNVGVGAALRALGGQLTLTAGGVIDNGGGGAVTAVVQANIFKATANGALGTAPNFAFTNVANDVNSIDVDLSTLAGNPIGTGIRYVDANAITVSNAVTQTGTIDIRSIGGALTVPAQLGTVPGQTLTGVTLRAADAVQVTAAGGIAVSGNGNVQLTSDTNAVSVLGAIAVAQGDVGLVAHGAITVNGASGIVITGKGNISANADSDAITIAGPLTASNGTVTLSSGGGLTGVTVNNAIFANGAVSISGVTGITVSAVGAIAVQAVNDVTLQSTQGNIAVSGDVQASSGTVRVTATAGLVNLTGNISAGTGATNDAVLSAGSVLVVTGNVTAGRDCSLAAVGAVNLGPAAGASNTVMASTGSVTVSSTGGALTINSDITALAGRIVVTTPSTVTFSGGLLTVSPTYVAGPPATGLVSITGTLGITALTNPIVTAGRLEVISQGGSNVALTSPNNQVSTLKASTAGNFTFVDAIPLTLTDFVGTAASVQISGQNVSITSLQGLRIVDGIKYTGTLTLAGPTTGRGVEFVPSSTGDNSAAGAAFAGTLRDMIGYVNANAQANQPMSIVFDESGTTLATTTGEISLTASLPNVIKPILFDGVLPSGGTDVGGNVGIRGNGVPAAAAANGLTLGTGSSGSTIRSASFSEFAGAGVSVLSGNNLLSGLVIGARRTGAAGANGVGIDLVGSAAARNTIGIKTVGTDAPNQIINNTTAGVRIRSGANFNLLYGNFVGITQGGVAAGNQGDGVSVQSSIGTAIGSTSAVLGNTISGNGGNGVRLTDVFAGTLPYGAQVIGNTIRNNAAAGVRIEGGGKNLVGGTTPPAANLIEGNNDGVVLASSTAGVTQGNTIVGNAITASTRYGAFIDLAYGNTIDGNTVAVSGNTGIRISRATASRTQAANQVLRNTVSGNGDTTSNSGGIVLENSSGQMVGRLVGSALPSYANIVTGNNGSGIVILGGANPSVASLNVVENNLVGVDASGIVSENTKDGIRVVGGITNTIRSNTVRGNTENGISLIDAQATTAAVGNVVAGNVVGGNKVGVYVAGGSNNLIGGTLASAGNRIFASGQDGIRVESSTGTGAARATVIRNNVIGRDATSAVAGNAKAGVRLTNTLGTVIDYANTVTNSGEHGIAVQGGRDNVIGSAIVGRGNAILSNTGNGIQIEQPAAAPNLTQAVIVAGNSIRSNTGYGVNVSGSRTSGVTIGRAPSVSQPTGAENVIRDNSVGGVQVDAAVAITVVGNEIVNNGAALADQIRLLNNGNAGVVAPVLTAATKRVSGQAAPQYDVSGTVVGASGQQFYVDFYGIRSADGRQFFLGRVGVTVGKTGTGSFRTIVGSLASQLGNRSVDQIVATATPASSLNGGTSAFSNARNV